MTDTVNKQKLLDRLHSLMNGTSDPMIKLFIGGLIVEVESNLFDSPPTTPVQGYREALIAIKNEMRLWNDAYSAMNVIAEIVDQALYQTDIQPSGWIPESQAPKVDDKYLVTDGATVEIAYYSGTSKSLLWQTGDWSNMYDGNITHWMPLPVPPGINSTEDQPGPCLCPSQHDCICGRSSTEEEETDA